MLGFALESTSGFIWLSVNGVWIGKGNPTKHRRPLLTLERGNSDMFPVAGVPSGCGQRVRVTIHSTPASLHYQPPRGFMPPVSDSCTCTTIFAECLDSPGCLGEGERYAPILVPSSRLLLSMSRSLKSELRGFKYAQMVNVL